MLTIDIMLKNTSIPISIQKKETEQAQTLYQQLLTAMKNPQPEVIEIHCDKEPGKTVALLSEQISAVIMSEKSGSTGATRGAGFFATVTE